MTPFLRKWFPIDRASRKSPLRQVVEHVASVVWLPVMVAAMKCGWGK